jgi:hypothetical protein
MDVRVLSASCADESILADGEIVESRPPDAGVKLRVTNMRGDGGQKARRTEETTYKP